jgi:hypothetical protein
VNIIKRTCRKESTHTESTTNIEVVEERGDNTRVHGRSDGVPARAHGVPYKGPRPQAAIWTHLQQFEIEYPPRAGSGDAPTVKVFANGRQQIRIRVKLSPRDSQGQYVRVPCDELLARLTLVTYSAGVPLPAGWAVQRAWNGYGYDAAVIPDASAGHEAPHIVDSPHDNRAEGCEEGADYVSFEVFVTTTVDEAVQIAASITPPNSSQPIQTRPGAAGGAFDSSVNIYGRPALNSPPSDFNVRDGGYDHSHLEYFTVQSKFITLSRNGRRINLREIKDSSGNIGGSLNIYADNGDFDARGGSGNGEKWLYEGVFTVLAKPRSQGGLYYYDVPDQLKYHAQGSGFYVYDKLGYPQNYEDGSVQFLLHFFDENLHFFWGGNEAGEVLSRNALIMDEYGNEHRVRIGVPSLGLDFKVLGNW